MPHVRGQCEPKETMTIALCIALCIAIAVALYFVHRTTKRLRITEATLKAYRNYPVMYHTLTDTDKPLDAIRCPMCKRRHDDCEPYTN